VQVDLHLILCFLDEENDKSPEEMSKPTEYENITFTFEAAGPKPKIVIE
jgi:hypothetical protein